MHINGWVLLLNGGDFVVEDIFNLSNGEGFP